MVLLVVGAEVPEQEKYLTEGYCVVSFPLRLDLVMTLVYRAVSPLPGLKDQQLQELLGRVGAAGGLSFVVNVVLYALQVLYGGAAWRSAGVGLLQGEP